VAPHHADAGVCAWSCGTGPRAEYTRGISPRPPAGSRRYEGGAARSQPRCTGRGQGSPTTGHQTQRPRGQVGPPGAHPAHPSSQPPPGPRGRTANGGQYVVQLAWLITQPLGCALLLLLLLQPAVSDLGPCMPLHRVCSTEPAQCPRFHIPLPLFHSTTYGIASALAPCAMHSVVANISTSQYLHHQAPTISSSAVSRRLLRARFTPDLV
jgi:hypothetical protein